MPAMARAAAPDMTSSAVDGGIVRSTLPREVADLDDRRDRTVASLSKCSSRLLGRSSAARSAAAPTASSTSAAARRATSTARVRAERAPPLRRAVGGSPARRRRRAAREPGRTADGLRGPISKLMCPIVGRAATNLSGALRDV